MATFTLPTRSLYAYPEQVKAMLGAIATGQDSMLMYLCEQASQKVDEYCAPRWFYPLYKTSIYDWPGTSFELCLRDDLLFLDQLINGDGSVIPATTTISGQTVISYFFYPADVLPKTKIALNIASGFVYLFIGTPQQAIQLKGMFGYPSNESRGIWNANSGVTVVDNPQTANTTTLTVPTGSFLAGETVYIGTELELIQAVTTGSTNDTCTVLRGHNGTTAAIHTQGSPIYRVLVHPVIAKATNRLVQWYFRQKDAADFGRLQVGTAGMSMIELPASIPVDIASDLLPLQRQHF